MEGGATTFRVSIFLVFCDGEKGQLLCRGVEGVDALLCDCHCAAEG